MPPDKAKEQLERLQLDQERRSQRRGYRGPSLGTEQRMATLGLMSEGIDPDQFDTRKQWDMAVNERMTAEREARGPMAFSTAEGRLVPMQQEAPSPLTQTPNLRFPATQGAGGELGMDRERINQTAMNEAMRLGGGQITDESRAQVIQTPYGIMSSRSEFSPTEGSQRMTQADFESSAGGFQGFDRPERYAATPTGGFQRQLSGEEDRSLAMAGMAEKGAAIRSSLEEQGQQRYAAFRQGLEERRAQEALTPFGNQPVGRAGAERAAQATVEAERWNQAQTGRDPMSREPLSAMGMQFRRGSMGEYTPMRSLTTPSGFVPSEGQQSLSSVPQFGGGGFPSFEEWMGQRSQNSFGAIAGNIFGSPPQMGRNDFALSGSRDRLRRKKQQEEYIDNTVQSGGSIVEYPVALPSGQRAIRGWNSISPY
jgi:hypothetical protein